MLAVSRGALAQLKGLMYIEGASFCSAQMTNDSRHSVWLSLCFKAHGGRVESGGGHWLRRIAPNETAVMGRCARWVESEFNASLQYAGVHQIRNESEMAQWTKLEEERRLRLLSRGV